MKGYRIESQGGIVMGTYQGETPLEAVQAMLQDAGEDGEVTYTTSPAEFRRGNTDFLVQEEKS